MVDEWRVESRIYGHLSSLVEMFTQLDTYILTHHTHTHTHVSGTWKYINVCRFLSLVRYVVWKKWT